MRSCTVLYTSLKNSVASTHAIRVFTNELCASLYTAKKSYFALSSLFAFLRTLSYLRSCTILYTSLKNSVASTHAIRVFTNELCASLYTAKKSYFALSSLFAFPRALRYLRSCTTLYTSLKNSVASTHAIRVFTNELCTSLYTAKKSYFALSSLFAFLRILSYLLSCGLLLKFKNQ